MIHIGWSLTHKPNLAKLISTAVSPKSQVQNHETFGHIQGKISECDDDQHVTILLLLYYKITCSL